MRPGARPLYWSRHIGAASPDATDKPRCYNNNNNSGLGLVGSGWVWLGLVGSGWVWLGLGLVGSGWVWLGLTSRFTGSQAAAGSGLSI